MKKTLTFILFTALAFNFSSCDDDDDQRCAELQTEYSELIRTTQDCEQLLKLHAVISEGKDCNEFADLALGTGYGSVDKLLEALEADITLCQEGE